MATGWHGESKRHSIAKKYGKASSKDAAISPMSSKSSDEPECQIIRTCPMGQDPTFFPKNMKELKERLLSFEDKGMKSGMDRREARQFAVFMSKAFPGEAVWTSYTNEWVERFKKALIDKNWMRDFASDFVVNEWEATMSNEGLQSWNNAMKEGALEVHEDVW